MAISSSALRRGHKPCGCAVRGDVPRCPAVLRALAPSQRHGAQGSCWRLQSVLRLKTEMENKFAIDFASHEVAKAFQWAEAAFA